MATNGRVNSREEQTALFAAIEGGNPYRAFRAAKDHAGKDMTSRFAQDGAHATGQLTAVLLANIYARPTAGLPLLGTGWSPSPDSAAYRH